MCNRSTLSTLMWSCDKLEVACSQIVSAERDSWVGTMIMSWYKYWDDFSIWVLCGPGANTEILWYLYMIPVYEQAWLWSKMRYMNQSCPNNDTIIWMRNQAWVKVVIQNSLQLWTTTDLWVWDLWVWPKWWEQVPIWDVCVCVCE
jgi:hypothetical protein